MTVVLTLVNGITKTFETDKYVISSSKDFHPLILKIDIYDGGKKIARRKRRFIWWYKRFTFNSFKVQQKLKELQERQ